MMPWYVQLALRQLRPAGRRFGSFFFVMSVLGVGLGVMVLVVVQSVMAGFGSVHRERIVETTGHITITSGGQPFMAHDELMEGLEAREAVETASDFAMAYLMAQYENKFAYPVAYGLNLARPNGILIEEFLWGSGSLDALDDESVFISVSTANQLGVFQGDTVEIYTPLMIQMLSEDEVLLPREFRIAGIYDLDWNEKFAPGMIFTLRTLQELYNLGDLVHGVTLRLQEDADEFALATELVDKLDQHLLVSTWKEQWKDFLWVLDLEKTMLLFINLFIVAVAVFAIAMAQSLTVVRKTREIGLIGAMGGKWWELALLFCIQGFIIGVVGTALGMALAFGALSVRDHVIGWISEMTGTADTLRQFYYFARLPVNYVPRDFIIITASALILSVLASFIPAWRAARMRPAESLRIDQ